MWKFAHYDQGHVHTNPDIFETKYLLSALLLADFGIRIHWFRVGERKRWHEFAEWQLWHDLRNDIIMQNVIP